MSHRTRFRPLLGGLALLAGLAFSAAAQARTETLRWTHPNAAGVAGYKIYYGTAAGQHPNVIDVGALVPQSGVVHYDLVVPDHLTIYVTVTAYDQYAQESGKSNEKQRVAPLGRPGQPRLAPE
jgi:hypothetical protein